MIIMVRHKINKKLLLRLLVWQRLGRNLKLAREDVLDLVLKDSLLKSGCQWLSIIL